MRGRTYGLLTGLVFTLCVVGVSSVFAVENAPDPEPGMVGITSTEENSSDEGAIRSRVEERKQQSNTRLSAAEQRRVQARCKAAQSKVAPLQAKIDDFEIRKGEQHDALLNRLSSLGNRLSGASDTTLLSSQITELESRIARLNTLIEVHRLAVLDLSLMDCAADPIGFKATLDAARKSRQDMLSELRSLNTFLTDTLKPTVQSLKSSATSSSRRIQ